MTISTLAPNLRLTGFASLAALALGLLAACGGGSDSGPRIERVGEITLTQENICDVDLHTTPPDVSIHGAAAGDFLADRFSLAAGDFNGDGVGDILVGAPLADGPDARENAGKAYVIFGSAAPPDLIDLADENVFTLIGENAGDNLGFTVAAGDVNADGTDDVIVGARFAGLQERLNAGVAYILYGGQAGLIQSPVTSLDLAVASADVEITGSSPRHMLTVALATGDLDGDGTADILLGASGAAGPDGDRPNAGAAMVVLGSSSLPQSIDLSETPPAMIVHGARADDNLPNRLAGGDLDGDGREELIIGVPFADPPGREDAGSVYVVPYASGETIDLAGSTPAISGGAQRDGLGFAVAAADLNGDGFDELIAGARDADGPNDTVNNAGEVHVMFGGDNLPPAVDLRDDASDMFIYSRDPGDSLGFTIDTADVNGDGLEDVLLGAPLAGGCQNGRFGAGDVYTVFGRRAPVPAAIALENAGDLTYFGPNEGDAAGFSLAATDFNADGRIDIAIGALQADGPEGSREDAGAVFIVLGASP